ncbi:MAG: TldD protein, part of TldE/TldD proteolytic complex [Candidatus Saccharicenans subterraneus]|uniref:TldD protein, part of TldE/TldD proteolytic complex n=1 Tax=Candidatus Saccharicenans subterraneus TaxID=2508984 RepID=A0A3E2BKT4_9BACT|nr:MAG: TldD protein, part of TldE/TldD proteolytic complex [Candidatus Saccharicenans subterraneum]
MTQRKRAVKTEPNYFHLQPEELKRVLSLALARGGDFADIFLEYRTSLSILMEEDIIKESSENVILGLGLRVIRKDKTGYAYTNDLSEEKLRSVALTASAIASGRAGQKFPFRRLRNLRTEKDVARARLVASSRPLQEKIQLVERAYRSALNYNQSIRKVQVAYGESLQHIKILNSEGVLVEDRRPMVKLVVMALAEKNGRRESGFCGGGGRVGLEYFKRELTPETIGQEAAREACLLLEAVDPPAGEMPVVLSPGHSGVLIHEAVGHLLEADFIRKKTSVLWNKLGKKVGSEQLNIYDDPTRPGFRGSYNFDDEGSRPHKTLLVEKGVVRGFLQDLLSARLMKKEPTGHGRREDFSCWPLPRMANTYIDRGDYDPEEIIRSVRKGFYVSRLSGGQVEDSGQFTFSVTLGYLIEDGRLGRPVRQATLIGTNLDILQKVEMVGSDLEFGWQTGTCSKEGQDVPVADGCPTMKISRMTVGGLR